MRIIASSSTLSSSASRQCYRRNVKVGDKLSHQSDIIPRKNTAICHRPESTISFFLTKKNTELNYSIVHHNLAIYAYCSKLNNRVSPLSITPIRSFSTTDTNGGTIHPGAKLVTSHTNTSTKQNMNPLGHNSKGLEKITMVTSDDIIATAMQRHVQQQQNKDKNTTLCMENLLATAFQISTLATTNHKQNCKIYLFQQYNESSNTLQTSKNTQHITNVQNLTDDFNNTPQQHYQFQNLQPKISIQNEIQAAEALLKLTNSFRDDVASFRKALHELKKQKQTERKSVNNDVTLSLQHAFLSVTSWLCSTIDILQDQQQQQSHHLKKSSMEDLDDATNLSNTLYNSEQEILLRYILDLTKRSFDLSLPFTLPLYQHIINHVATYYKPQDDSILIILDLSTQIRDVLQQEDEVQSNDDDDIVTQQKQQLQTNLSNERNTNFLTSAFFSSTLQKLLKQGKIRSVVDLLHGMRSIHDIHNVDLQTAVKLLLILNQQHNILGWKDEEPLQNEEEEEEEEEEDIYSDYKDADAMELVLLLQKPVMDELELRRREMEYYNRLFDKFGNVNVEGIDNDNDNDDQYDYDQDYDDDDEDDNNSISTHGENMDLLNDFEEDDDDKDDDLSNDIVFQNNQLNIQENSNDLSTDIKQLNDLVESMVNGKTKGNEIKDLATSILKKIEKKKIETSYDIEESSNDNKINDFGALSIDNTKHQFSSSSSSHEQQEQYDELQSNDNEIVHKMSYKDMIYIRDSNWFLPDLVPQLEQLNGKDSMLFSKEYEQELMENLPFDTDDDYDDDDDDFTDIDSSNDR